MNSPVSYFDFDGLRVISLNVNILGQRAGVFIDTGSDGVNLFEGVSDIGVFVDTGGLSGKSIMKLLKKLKAKVEFGVAHNRDSFDVPACEKTINFLVAEHSTTGEGGRHKIGLGLGVPGSSADQRTIRSVSVGDIVRGIRDTF